MWLSVEECVPVIQKTLGSILGDRGGEERERERERERENSHTEQF
jgi:hypothetical protein